MKKKCLWLKAALFSFVAILLCCSLLLGTTLAWFTSSSVSVGNSAQSGELNVQLLKYDEGDYQDVSNGSGDIFGEENGINWEPGRTEVVFLAVKNAKDLAMSFTLIMETKQGETELIHSLEYSLIPNMTKDAFEALKVSSWNELTKVDGAITEDVIKGQSFASSEYELLSGEMMYFVFAVHMKENAENTIQNTNCSINIKVAATQTPYESGSFGSDYDTNPYPEEVWIDLIDKLTFESRVYDKDTMTAVAGNPEMIADETRYESKAILKLNVGDRFGYDNRSVPQSMDGTYKLSGWFKKDNPDTVVTITYWHRIDVEKNETVEVELTGDNILISTPGGWSYFEIIITHLAPANMAKFYLNNYKSTGDAAGNVYFDDIQYRGLQDEINMLVEEWEEKLAAEKANNVTVANGVSDPYKEIPAEELLSGNLLENSDFSADGQEMLLCDKEVIAHMTGWKTIDLANVSAANAYDVVTKLTAEGAVRGENPVGYNDPKIYKRAMPQIRQTVKVSPGATYMIKYRYRIEQSNEPTATWYGPVCYATTYGVPLPGVEENELDHALLRVDYSTEGIKTDGEWHWFTQCWTLSSTADTLGIDMQMWLYPGDWCEIDDVQLYLVDYGDRFELDLETKFFYDDEETTQFTADLNEVAFPDIAADTNTTVKFEVYDGPNLVWNSDMMQLSGDGYVAETEFDLTKMTKIGEPYVVLATMYDGSGAELYSQCETIYRYERPTYLSEDGKFAKLTPDGEKLDFHMGYAVLQSMYEKCEEIGLSVMSLSLAQSADQVLERLDYCLKYGYMGMINLNWGLYNENDMSVRRWVVLDVVTDERITNHPALLGYCLGDEPWSWGAEAAVAADMEEGYRIVREYDKHHLIFNINNMAIHSEKNAWYGDAVLNDFYDRPANGAVYEKIKGSVSAANGRIPVWNLVAAYTEKGDMPSADQLRNTLWQVFLGGGTGVGYYCIYNAGYDLEGNKVPLWEATENGDVTVGPSLWNAITTFYEKESDIAFDFFDEGKGAAFNEKIAIEDGYMYKSWVAEDGNIYLIVLNVAGDQTVNVSISLTSDKGSVTVGSYAASVVNGSDQSDFTGSGTVTVTLLADQAVLYKITSKDSIDISSLR